MARPVLPELEQAWTASGSTSAAQGDPATGLAVGLLFLGFGMFGVFSLVRSIRGKNAFFAWAMEESVRRGTPEQRERWTKIVSVLWSAGAALIGLLGGSLAIVSAVRGRL